MTAARTLEALRTFAADAPDISVMLAADIAEQQVLQRLVLKQKLAQEFKAVVTKRLAEDLDLRRYEPGYKPDSNEMLFLRLNDEPGISETLEMVRRVDQAEIFKEDQAVIEGLQFYGIVLGEGTNRVTCLRVYSQKRELTRSGKFAAVFRKGSYDKVKRNVFVFDSALDCFAWREYLFVRNVVNFQRMFDYFARVMERAGDASETIGARVPIRNFKEFKAACTGQPQMMAKVVQIAKKPYLATLTFADLRKTISKFNLKVDIVEHKNAESLVFDNSREKRWLILKLLDDDYLGSTMTRQKYEVNSKSTMS